MTRRPLVLQLHKMEEGQTEYAEFLHLPKRRFTDFGTLDLIQPLSFFLFPVLIHFIFEYFMDPVFVESLLTDIVVSPNSFEYDFDEPHGH